MWGFLSVDIHNIFKTRTIIYPNFSMSFSIEYYTVILTILTSYTYMNDILITDLADYNIIIEINKLHYYNDIINHNNYNNLQAY